MALYSSAASDLGLAAQAPIGSGMADISRDTIMAQKAYQQHVIDAQSNGDTPMSFDDFRKQWMQSKKSQAATDLGMGQ